MKNRRLLAHITIVLVILSSLVTLMVYSVPIVVKSKITALIQQETGRKATLAELKFSLFPLSIQLQNFALQEINGKPFASFASFYGQVNVVQSLKQSMLVIDTIALVKPVVRITQQKTARLTLTAY